MFTSLFPQIAGAPTSSNGREIAQKPHPTPLNLRAISKLGLNAIKLFWLCVISDGLRSPVRNLHTRLPKDRVMVGINIDFSDRNKTAARPENSTADAPARCSAGIYHATTGTVSKKIKNIFP